MIKYRISRIDASGEHIDYIELTSGQYARLSNAVDQYVDIITGLESKAKYQQILDLLDSI